MGPVGASQERSELRPIGVVLAGGRGRRIGGSKAVVELCGRPLVCYPVEAMKQALPEVAVIAKPETQLPSLPGVTVWIEPSEPQHPITGLLHALALADGRPVLSCPVDVPFVTPGVISALAAADTGGSPAVIAASHGITQPLLGCYQPEALHILASAAQRVDLRLTDVVGAIGPRTLEVDGENVLFNVNGPDDLLQATAMLSRT